MRYAVFLLLFLAGCASAPTLVLPDPTPMYSTQRCEGSHVSTPPQGRIWRVTQCADCIAPSWATPQDRFVHTSTFGYFEAKGRGVPYVIPGLSDFATREECVAAGECAKLRTPTAAKPVPPPVPALQEGQQEIPHP